jgi:hypothetical protein
VAENVSSRQTARGRVTPNVPKTMTTTSVVFTPRLAEELLRPRRDLRGSPKLFLPSAMSAASKVEH